MKTVLTVTAGITLLCLGALGLLLPFLPGFLFLLGAAACFATLSPALHRTLHRQPRVSRFLHRLDASTHLPIVHRVKLAFWAGLEAITPRKT